MAHVCQSYARMSQVGQHEPGVSEIKFCLRHVLTNISEPELNVQKALRFSFRARQFQLDLVDIRRDHSTFRTDDACQIEGQITASATNLQAGHSRLDAGSMQESMRGGLHYTRENPEALPSFDPTA